jgi:hypothetical protein
MKYITQIKYEKKVAVLKHKIIKKIRPKTCWIYIAGLG